MIRVSSLKVLAVVLPVLALSAAPAFAGKLSLQNGQNLCKAAAAPASVKFDEKKATTAGYHFVMRVKDQSGATTKVACKVDDNTKTASLAAVGAATSTAE